MRVVGLFAGIGGIELGLSASGFETTLLCEKDQSAQRVLAHRFPDIPLHADVTTLASLPPAQVVTAGFPCTDLSQVGQTRGISGSESGLINHVFRLLDTTRKKPEWILLENVPFMLRLQGGRAIRMVTRALEKRGYSWAYRTVDTRAFGLPQRRKRVFLLAAMNEDPRDVLLADETNEPKLATTEERSVACGFYWTEGNRGLGWAINAIPTLKAGSSVGIPSPPAIRLSNGCLGIPDVRDAERLQGFEAYWTSPAAWDEGRLGYRWKLIGNAVSVPASRWIGRRLVRPGEYDSSQDARIAAGQSWPDAAWGRDGKMFVAARSQFPVRYAYRDLEAFLKFPIRPLSLKAANGFLRRIRASSLRIPAGLEESLETHCSDLRKQIGDAAA